MNSRSRLNFRTPNVAALFSLAEKLGYFKSALESGLKVANTGKKTFRYEPELARRQKPSSTTLSM